MEGTKLSKKLETIRREGEEMLKDPTKMKVALTRGRNMSSAKPLCEEQEKQISFARGGNQTHVALCKPRRRSNEYIVNL